MYHSLWAPKRPNRLLTTTTTNPTSNTFPSTQTSPVSSLQNIRRLTNRLKWKSSLLQISYPRAVTSSTSPSLSVTPQTELQPSAPTMFALDFYEYYTLLERILVLLLAFFNIRVPRETVLHTEPVTAPSRSHTNGNGNGHVSSFNGGEQQQQQQRTKYTHRYHANVLSALDAPSNPLYHVLGGQQPVRRYLDTAKDFRNRWKEGGEDSLDYGEGREEGQGSKVKREMLEALDLEGMMEVIGEALARALDVAEMEGERRAGKSNAGLWSGEVRNGNGNGGVLGAREMEDCDLDMEDAPFEVVEDAMEWEGL